MEYYRLSFPFIPAYVRSLFTTSHESSYHRPRYCRQLPGMGAETARSGFYDCRPSHCGNGIPRSRRTGESADRAAPSGPGGGRRSVFPPFPLFTRKRNGNWEVHGGRRLPFSGSWKRRINLRYGRNARRPRSPALTPVPCFRGRSTGRAKDRRPTHAVPASCMWRRW